MQWREKYKSKMVTAEEAVQCIKNGDKVAVTEAHGTSKVLLRALVDRLDELSDITVLTQLMFPESSAILREGYAKGLRNFSNFGSAATVEDFKAHNIEYMPAFFFELPRYYAEVNVPEVAFIMLSMPDENGVCSFGLNADAAVMLSRKAKTVIVQINKNMPRTHGVSISLDDVDYIVEHHDPIEVRDRAPVGAIEKAIGEHIVPYIPDGACLQLGIGGLPDAVLAHLYDRKDLGIHTELFSDGVVDLYNAGVITNACKNIDKGKLVTNFLIGSQKLFDFVDNNPDVCMMPVDYTNDPRVIAQNDNVISVNSALQIDLMGQVNANTLNGINYSGVGGQVDFLRGASMSKGGKSFITLPSTAKRGELSRIVPRLPIESPVTTSCYDVHYVCTEYGAVDLRGKTVQQRAQLLISIADPKFRDELTFEAKKIGYLY